MEAPIDPPAERPTLLLWGMSGSGKSSLAPLLASHLDALSIDLDAQIERAAGHSIAEIFARDGESAFRTLERARLRELLLAPPATRRVVALGGGALVDTQLRAAALRRAYVVVLDAPLDELARRLAKTRDRPLLSGDRGIATRLAKLKSARADAYAEAHLQIATWQRTLTQLVEQISAHWQPR